MRELLAWLAPLAAVAAAARRSRDWLVPAAVVDVCFSLEPFYDATAVRALGIPEMTVATRIKMMSPSYGDGLIKDKNKIAWSNHSVLL